LSYYIINYIANRFKFDDDRVTPVVEREVLEDNYSDEFSKANTNVYELVYILESDIDVVFSPVFPEDIPPHLRMYSIFYIFNIHLDKMIIIHLLFYNRNE